MSFFGKTVQNLEKSLDYASLKNRTIANYITNVDTPNFKANRVVFKNLLENELGNTFEAKRTHPKHIPFHLNGAAIPFRVVSDQSTTFNHNGNNVDIDKEMVSLAENQIYYQGLVDRINGKFNSLQTVIKGGR